MTEFAPGALTDVPGIQVGHATNLIAWTGCTVVLAKEGAIAGGVVRGLAPGTRETDLLRPATLVEKAHGILLTGGSAFGLAAADGVMRYLEEQGIGYNASGVRVPIVPGAVLFDLGIGDPSIRPDAAMGYAACQAAHAKDQSRGNVGAGTGATVGKLMGMGKAMKGGLGQASVQAGHLIVAALMAVNAFGDIVDPASGEIIAGARNMAEDGFLDTAQAMRHMIVRNVMALQNTVIGVVVTNARLDVAQTNEMAWAAHDGLARAVRPSHSLYDGDAIFGLATGKVRAHQALVSDMAAEATTLAILNAVWAAETVGDLPAARTWWPEQ